ncbi:kynurenine 3-monooxygenase [Daldinia decipiens]|uniref:kynurenine 3-monooxygenase n=1 Tax=Daldinia decipiens TaxID=326647 RepID=UPI0020C32671|nr:kynurenine 3-monooxygenase [Daldinia decipiens]KAI1660480.1 kynurenine 3-monooxygenase [Daldinia decipiens]
MVLTAPPAEVAIIGGGLAGLTLALALHDLNIPSTVYEARSADFDQGGGIMLSPNALRVLDSVGVYKRIRDNSLQFDILTFKDVQDKTTDVYYFGSEELYGYHAIRIMRKQLLDELKAMVRERNIPIHFDSKLTAITSDGPDKVEFTFADGRVASAPLVIGADGIHSTVRGTFLPQVKPMYAGFMGINSVVQRSQLRIPEGYSLPATVMAKPGAFLLVPQKPDGSELFIGSQRRFPGLDAAGWEALRKDKQKLYEMLQENKSDWPDIVQSALEATPVDRMGFWAFHGIPPLASWLSESKRIILVGDAAHAIPPTAGQGANQAFEDVRALATLLSKLSPEVPLDKAAAQWQTYRQERVKKVLDLTNQMNAKRLPESERAKMPPGAIWSDQSLTRGEGGELGWLYNPDLTQEAEKWVEELKQAANP